MSNIAALSYNFMILTAFLLTFGVLGLLQKYGLPKLSRSQLWVVLSYSVISMLFGYYLFMGYYEGPFSMWLNRFGRVLVGLILIFGVLALSNIQGGLFRFYKSVILGTALAFVTAIIQLLRPNLWEQWAYNASDLRIIPEAGQSGRAFGIWQNSLDFSFVLLIGIIAVLILKQNRVYSKGFLYSLILPLYSALIIFSFSRVASCVLLIGIGSYLLLSKRRKYILAVVLITIALVGFGIANKFIRGAAEERYAFFSSEGLIPTLTGFSTTARLEIAKDSIDAAINGPSYGYGLGGYLIALSSYVRPHNMFLQLWLEFGWMGLLFSSLLTVTLIICAQRSGSNMGISIFVVLIVLGSTLFLGHIILVFWFQALIALILTFKYTGAKINEVKKHY